MVKYEPVIWDIETTGLNPLAQYWWNNEKAARVTAIGLATVPGWRTATKPEDVDINVKVLHGGNEYGLLESLNSEVRDMFVGSYRWDGDEAVVEDTDPVLVGFNSRNFDHPYIGARLSRSRLGSSWVTDKAKRIDMMRVAGDKDGISDYPSQDDYANLLGYATEDEYDGSMMPEFYEKKQWDKIKSHVESDVMELAQCFVADKEAAMEHFYDHYDIPKEAVFETGVSSW